MGCGAGGLAEHAAEPRDRLEARGVRDLAHAARALVDSYDDAALARVMTNLGGHDLGLCVDTFRELAASGDQSTCVIAYTIKGMGLPLAGHKDRIDVLILCGGSKDDLPRQLLGAGAAEGLVRRAAKPCSCEG